MNDNRVGSFVLNDKQPFGEVHEYRAMGGEGRPPEHINRPLGSETNIPNNAWNHPASMADKNPGAHEQACAHGSQPFFWVGHPKRSA